MSTELILMERVESLGQMGDLVRVKSGYARNYLLPQSKAMRATKENLAYFETQRKTLEAQNLKKKQEAEKVAKTLNGLKVVIIRQAAEGGQLYGSVASRDIVEAVTEAGVKIERHQIQLNQNFKIIGLFPVDVSLHPEVKVPVIVNIARSEDEAKTQAKTGKALIADDLQQAPTFEATDDDTAKEDLLEEDALEAEKQRDEKDATKEAKAQVKADAKAEKKAVKEAVKAAEAKAEDVEQTEEEEKS